MSSILGLIASFGRIAQREVRLWLSRYSSGGSMKAISFFLTMAVLLGATGLLVTAPALVLAAQGPRAETDLDPGLIAVLALGVTTVGCAATIMTCAVLLAGTIHAVQSPGMRRSIAACWTAVRVALSRLSHQTGVVVFAILVVTSVLLYVGIAPLQPRRGALSGFAYIGFIETTALLAAIVALSAAATVRATVAVLKPLSSWLAWMAGGLLPMLAIWLILGGALPFHPQDALRGVLQLWLPDLDGAADRDRTIASIASSVTIPLWVPFFIHAPAWCWCAYRDRAFRDGWRSVRREMGWPNRARRLALRPSR